MGISLKKKKTKMPKIIENFFSDEGFEEFTESIIRYEDNREIEKITKEKEDEIDIYKCAVHPIHLLEDLKHLYDANGIQWYQNEHGNVLARGETCRATPYVFYVNWESATTVYFYTESKKSFFTPFGEWTWDMVPIKEMQNHQARHRQSKKRKYAIEDEEGAKATEHVPI